MFSITPSSRVIFFPCVAIIRSLRLPSAFNSLFSALSFLANSLTASTAALPAFVSLISARASRPPFPARRSAVSAESPRGRGTGQYIHAGGLPSLRMRARPAAADAVFWPRAEIRAVHRRGIENADGALARNTTALKGVKICAPDICRPSPPAPCANGGLPGNRLCRRPECAPCRQARAHTAPPPTK